MAYIQILMIESGQVIGSFPISGKVFFIYGCINYEIISKTREIVPVMLMTDLLLNVIS